VSAKMTKSLNVGTDALTTSGKKRRTLKGTVAPIAIVTMVKTLTLAAVAASYYVLAFFASVQVVPLTMGFVKAGTGVTLDMPLETVLSVWVVPALFLVALVFVLVLVVMRALWRLRTRVVAAVSLWALGEEPTVEIKAGHLSLNKRSPHMTRGARTVAKKTRSAGTSANTRTSTQTV